MKVIGITGGVGAGKSRILKLLNEQYGAEVILADEVAHELMEPGQKGYQWVTGTFGSALLREDQTINREALADLLFKNPDSRKAMDHAIHPMVWDEIKRRICDSKSSLIVVETAIPGKKLSDICHELWYVYTSRENRIKRLEKDRGYSAEKSEHIINAQLPEEAFRKLCDHVIDNNGSFEETLKQLDDLLNIKDR